MESGCARNHVRVHAYWRHATYARRQRPIQAREETRRRPRMHRYKRTGSHRHTRGRRTDRHGPPPRQTHTHTQAHSLADARAHQLARGGQGQREHERRLFAEEHGREKRGTCSRMASAFISLIRWALSVSKSSSSSRSTSVSLNAFTYTRTKASPREQRGPARRGLGRRGRKKRACSHALTR